MNQFFEFGIAALRIGMSVDSSCFGILNFVIRACAIETSSYLRDFNVMTEIE